MDDCKEASHLRYLWYTTGAASAAARLKIHLRTCPKCRAVLKANANTPDNPDVTIEQIMTITDLSKPL